MKDEVWEFKRERILEEAVPLFAKYGFQSVSIDKIAKNLKVTKPFIYTYFKNKESLLEEIFQRAVANTLVGADDASSSKARPEERLAAFTKFYVLDNIHRSELTAVFLNEERHLSDESQQKLRAQHHLFDKKLANIIEDGIKVGIFQVDDPMLASLSISGMVRWVHRWYRPSGRFTPEQIADRIAQYVLNVVRYSPMSTPLSVPQ